MSDAAGLWEEDEGVKSDYGGMRCREYHCQKAATWSRDCPFWVVYNPIFPSFSYINTPLGLIPIFSFSPLAHFCLHFCVPAFHTRWGHLNQGTRCCWAKRNSHTHSRDSCIPPPTHTHSCTQQSTHFRRQKKCWRRKKRRLQLSFGVLSFSTVSTWRNAQIFNWLSQTQRQTDIEEYSNERGNSSNANYPIIVGCKNKSLAKLEVLLMSYHSQRWEEYITTDTCISNLTPKYSNSSAECHGANVPQMLFYEHQSCRVQILSSTPPHPPPIPGSKKVTIKSNKHKSQIQRGQNESFLLHCIWMYDEIFKSFLSTKNCFHYQSLLLLGVIILK